MDKDKEKENQKLKDELKLKNEEKTMKQQFDFTISQLKKIKWAKKKEVINGTIIVCSVSLGAILYFGLIDYVADFIKGLI